MSSFVTCSGQGVQPSAAPPAGPQALSGQELAILCPRVSRASFLQGGRDQGTRGAPSWHFWASPCSSGQRQLGGGEDVLEISAAGQLGPSGSIQGRSEALSLLQPCPAVSSCPRGKSAAPETPGCGGSLRPLEVGLSSRAASVGKDTAQREREKNYRGGEIQDILWCRQGANHSMGSHREQQPSPVFRSYHIHWQNQVTDSRLSGGRRAVLAFRTVWFGDCW